MAEYTIEDGIKIPAARGEISAVLRRLQPGQSVKIERRHQGKISKLAWHNHIKCRTKRIDAEYIRVWRIS